MSYNYTEEILHLRKKVPQYPNQSTKWLFNKLRLKDKKFVNVGLDNLKVGQFYFMRYDLKGLNKSSRLEQFVPMMVVDYKPLIDKKVVWILNMNFLPINLKESFFSSFLDSQQTILDNNFEQKEWSKELVLKNINYENVWKKLLAFGFEYSIREIRLDLINDIHAVSTDSLHFLTTQNTQALTGVDEGKLNEIWVTKLKNEKLGDRVKDLTEIKSNYQNILTELADKFKALNNRIKKL
jgi:hypothetical protein